MELRWLLLASFLLCLVSVLSVRDADAQSIIRGHVFDRSTNERMIGAKIKVTNLNIEAFTNVDGRFFLEVDLNEAITLEITATGYQRRSITVYDTTALNISLEHIFAQGYRNLTHSPVSSEIILDSDQNVDKIQSSELFALPNGQMLNGLTNYASVFGYHSGMNNLVLGFRGFTLVSHDRLLSTVNGIDSRLPGFASTLGGFSSPAEIDIASVELSIGPNSAIWGDGAYQGSLSIQTKDPWNYSGLDARVYGGSSSAFDAQVRFAQPFGKSRKWGFSASAQFQRVDDKGGVQEYGQHLSEYDLDSLLSNPGPDFSRKERDLLHGFRSWLNSEGQGAEPGMLFPFHRGYSESEVFEPEGRKLKLGASLHYKPSKKTEIQYAFRMSNGSMVYTNEQRFALHNLIWQQHNLSVKGKNWRITAYGSFESTGNSYSISQNALLISKSGAEEFARKYLLNYADSLRVWSGNFNSGINDSLFTVARDSALITARSAWFAPGTALFDSIAEVGQNIKGLVNGAGLYSRSNHSGINAQYRFDLNWLQVQIGAKFKRNDPISDGYFFSDSVDLSYLEYGGWTNFNFQLLKNKLELNATLRVEKTDLTKIQVAPRIGIRFKVKEHAIRASFNTGIRNPSFWELFRNTQGEYLTVGGNSNGYSNTINSLLAGTLLSVYVNAIEHGNWPADCPEGDEDCLKAYIAGRLGPTEVNRLEPERVNSVELGYRSVLLKNFYLDISAYHSWHYNLIRYDSYTSIQGGGNSPEALVENLTDSIIDTQMFIPVNSSNTLRTIGGTVLATYHFNDKIWANFNYTYTQMLDPTNGEPTISINVPPSKFNVGIRVKDLWQHLGFSLNYQWVGNHFWSGTALGTQVPSYSLLDAQISYRIPVMYSTFRIGGSNIINSPIRQTAAGPSLGATFYAAIQFDLSVR